MPLFCGDCGAQLEAGDAFCISCGTRQSPKDEPPKASASPRVFSQGDFPAVVPQATGRTRYRLLPIARIILRVMAVLYAVGGAVEFFVIVAASSAVPAGFGAGGILAGLGVLGGLSVFVVTLSAAVMAWAMADLIDIALRLEKTLPA